MSDANNYSTKKPLISAKNLVKHFNLKRKGILHAVDDVSFDIFPHETLALVGESGCGKTTVGNVVMRLLSPTSGALYYKDTNVFNTKGSSSMELRKKMQIIFQDPYSSLNPRKTIIKILSEAFEIHHYGSKEVISDAVKDICEKVEFPKSLLDHFPHELDGGMRQVVGIARALSLEPDFIVCDEPVSALDVSIQARIINMLMDLQQNFGIAYLFVSHDLSVVRHISKRIAVMYLGQIIESANTDDLFANTSHPYSIALLSAVPKINVDKKGSRIVLKGDVPSPLNPKPGCRFASRCWMVHEDCSDETPPLKEISPGHYVACYYVDESREKAKEIAVI